MKKISQKSKKEIGILSLKHLALISVGLIMVFPFIWMVMGAFKTNYEIWNEPAKLFPNQVDLGIFWDTLKSTPFLGYIKNSFITSSLATLIVLINSALFAYAVTKLEFRGREVIFWVVMGVYMLPAAVTYVPCYIMLAKANLLDTHMGLILSWTASIFGVFNLRQNFMKVNDSLIEAARIDGASELKILWKIVTPLTKSSFITLALLNFIGCYNSYMWPTLILNSEEKTLISNGLIRFFFTEGGYGMEWPKVMVGSTITVLPLFILFIILQKWFVTGIADDGVKE